MSEEIEIDTAQGIYLALLEVREEIAALEERKTLLEDTLKQLIGEGNTGTIAGRKVAKYSVYETSKFASKELAKDLPDIHQRYLRTSTVRAFKLLSDADND